MSTAKAELKALTGVGSSALFGCSAGTRDRGTIDLKKRDRTRTLLARGGSGRAPELARPHVFALSREGSPRPVKPPLSGGAHEYPPAENVPSAETSTGGTASSIPPPKTYTPAAFALSTTACASRPTPPHSPSGTTIAALGNEIRYFAIELFL